MHGNPMLGVRLDAEILARLTALAKASRPAKAP